MSKAIVWLLQAQIRTLESKISDRWSWRFISANTKSIASSGSRAGTERSLSKLILFLLSSITSKTTRINRFCLIAIV